MKNIFKSFVQVVDDSEENQNVQQQTAPPAQPTYSQAKPMFVPQPTTTAQPQQNMAQPPFTPATPVPEVAIDMELVRSLYQDLIDATGLSREYIDFKNNAEALVNMGMADKQRFEVAMRVIQVKDKSITKESLINSLNGYMQKLGEIKDAAMKECDEKRATINSTGEEQKQINQKSIDEKREIIERLKNEIAGYENEINQLLFQNNEADVKKRDELAKLDNQCAVFNESIKYVETTLISDKSVINSL